MIVFIFAYNIEENNRKKVGIILNGFEKRREEKEKQILEATFNLLNTNDSNKDNITMERIAKEANVGKTTIFKYFDNKENLIRKVFKNYIEEMIEEAREIVYQNKPFDETLVALSQNKIGYLNKITQQFYLEMMAYMTEKKDDELTFLINQYVKENQEMMLDLFYRGRKEGKVALKYSDEFLIYFFQAMVEGLSNPDVYEKMKPYVSEWTDILIKGVAPDR
ncbi:TetR family transcriptional regulator [Tetragenococcus koreensis]|uniref:TetR family transcriptional regulator n=1 Tax=Tetragenococcus koreensis TaxID=290335 RepID=A0AAN4UCW3_9ENTE|nr:TetR family transcriptional regulator [Tetragenococcus koreensis]GEQ50095.1 TetR family transcriptional regulator [Tetragenococcus koreensis]GEQ52589.1 TetR family transcriptional regulator [Tetragenococcus koreensis]GEQ55124.1 TetR family transcriptional regulator [Tetragenococcus koreensis]GEQ57579.1 TetR family transcriptional regulator [Tetragenococcus koreensis]